MNDTKPTSNRILSIDIMRGLTLYLMLFVNDLFKPAGQNSLTTYLAPDILYFAIWGLSLPLFFYKQESSQLLAVCGSFVWALAMVGFTALLARINIRLKL